MKNVQKIEIKLEKEWLDALDATFKEHNKDVEVAGFRKGKAPKDVFIKHFGLESLYSDAIQKCLEVAYKKVISENKVNPVIEPSVDVTGISDTNVIFEFTFISRPEVELGEYKNLNVKREKAKVTDEEINHEIEHIRSHMADMVVKENGEVSLGDTTIIDFKGMVDGKVVDATCGQNYPLEIGSHTFIPGFEEALIGMKSGETKDINLKFPENYVEEFKGKDVIFTVTVHEIKTRVLPDMNEDFFEDLGYDDVTDEESLKKHIKEELLHNEEHRLEDIFLDKVLEAVLKNTKIEINPEIIRDEANRMINQYAHELEKQGMNFNKFLEISGMKEEDLYNQMAPEAEKRCKYRFTLEAIAEKENLTFTKEELDKRVEELAQMYGVDKDEILKNFGSMDVVEYDLKMHKALEILKENN